MSKKNRKYLSEEQIEEIGEISIPFPIFFANEKNSTKIYCALYVTDVGETTVLNMPESISLEKMNPDGTITTAVYMLTESFKANEVHFNETMN